MKIQSYVFFCAVHLGWCKKLFIDEQLRFFQLIYLKNYLNIYSNYDLLFHIDLGQIHVTNQLISFIEEDSLNAVVVFNYDLMGGKNLTRPWSTKYVHIVVLNNPCLFDSYMINVGSLNYLDVVTFIIHDMQVIECLKINNGGLGKPFWFMDRLNLVGNVIIINISLSDISVSNTCYYCGKHTKQPKILEETDTPFVNLTLSEVLPRSFDNFHNHQIVVGYRDYFPFFLCLENTPENKNDTRVICNNSIGLESKLLETLAVKLNFTYKLVGDSEKYSHNQVIKNVMKKEVDFGIGGILMSSERLRHVTFTISIKSEDYTFLYVLSLSFWDRIMTLLRPFKLKAWLGIISLVIIVSFCLYAFARRRKFRSFNMSKSIEVCLKSIIEQPIVIKKLTLRLKFRILLLLTVWWLTCLEFDAVYKTKLASMLIHPPHKEPSNVFQLLNDGFELIVNYKTYEFIGKDAGRFLKKGKIITKYDICAVLEYVCENKAAMLAEFSKIQYHSYYNCPNITEKIKNSPNFDSFRLTRTPLYMISHGWPLNLGAAYATKFNDVIGSLQAGGFLDKWKIEALYNAKIRPFFFSSDTMSVYKEIRASLYSYMSIFIIYSLGILVAFFSFVLELKCFKDNYVQYGYYE